MFIDVFKNHGKPYLRLVHSVREPDKNGKMVSTRKVLLNIGPLDKYDDGEPDYVERLRRSFREGHPLIDILEPYCSMEPPKRQYSFKIEEGYSDCVGKAYIFSTVLLGHILIELGIKKCVNEEFKTQGQEERDIIYDYISLMVYKQILNPVSNITSFSDDSDLWIPIIKDFHSSEIYSVLTDVYDMQDKFINCLKGNTDFPCYFDVLTFHYKMMNPEEDTLYSLDERTGQYGFAVDKGEQKNQQKKQQKDQQHEHSELVLLYLNDEYVPIYIERFLDSKASKTKTFKLDGVIAYREPYILIGDYSTHDYKHFAYTKGHDYGYIVSKSLYYNNDHDRQWAYADRGYKKIGGTFKYKSRTVIRVYMDEGGRHLYTESMIVLWSKKLEERVAYGYKKTLEFIDRLERSSKSFHVEEKEKDSIRRFVSIEDMDQLNGDINSEQLRSMIDIPKVRAYLKHPGYFQIITSEISMGALEVIEAYFDAKQTEDQFRSMERTSGKDCFDLSSTAYDQACQIIDLMACAVTGKIRNKILHYKRYEKGSPSKPDLFNEMPIERIRDALNKWQVEELPGGLYRFLNLDDPDLQDILDAFHIHISTKPYTKKGINQIMRSILE